MDSLIFSVAEPKGRRHRFGCIAAVWIIDIRSLRRVERKSNISIEFAGINGNSPTHEH